MIAQKHDTLLGDSGASCFKRLLHVQSLHTELGAT